jgi:hypothetical protein
MAQSVPQNMPQPAGAWLVTVHRGRGDRLHLVAEVEERRHFGSRPVSAMADRP